MGIVLVKLDEMKTSSNVNSEMINPINKKEKKAKWAWHRQVGIHLISGCFIWLKE